MTTQVEPFVRFADVYDAIYTARGKDYAAEAAFILDTVGANVKRYRKPTYTKPAPVDLRHEIATECQVVIEALAD